MSHENPVMTIGGNTFVNSFTYAGVTQTGKGMLAGIPLTLISNELAVKSTIVGTVSATISGTVPISGSVTVSSGIVTSNIRTYDPLAGTHAFAVLGNTYKDVSITTSGSTPGETYITGYTGSKGITLLGRILPSGMGADSFVLEIIFKDTTYLTEFILATVFTGLVAAPTSVNYQMYPADGAETKRALYCGDFYLRITNISGVPSENAYFEGKIIFHA